MDRIRRCLGSTAVLACMLLPSATNAELVRYTYTGNAFTNITPGFPVSGITLWFTVDDSLVPRNGRAILDSYSVGGLQDYFFSNGLHTLTSEHTDPYRPYTSAIVSFDSDANGNVSGNWDAHASRAHGNAAGLILSDFVGSTSLQDRTYSLGGFEASVAGNPGTWTVSAAVPEPRTFLLFGVGVAGVLVMRRWSLSSPVVLASGVRAAAQARW